MPASLRLFLLALLAATTLAVKAAALPEAFPEAVGMSSARLARLDAALQHAVDIGELPGAVVMIARDGKLVHARNFGWQDRERKIAMNDDAIFRIYSMTKPIVSVAAMMLVEEGRLGLHEPISKFIPEFKDMKVGIETADASGKFSLSLVDAKRQITVQDLLRHTSGFTYGLLGAPTLIKKAYTEANIFSQYGCSLTGAARWRSCPWSTSRAQSGSTAIPPTYSGAWSKSCRASRSTHSSIKKSCGRCA